MQAIRAINGNENPDTTAEDFTNRVFDRIDINGDGERALRFREESIVGGQCLDLPSAPVLPAVGNTTGTMRSREILEAAAEHSDGTKTSHKRFSSKLNTNGLSCIVDHLEGKGDEFGLLKLLPLWGWRVPAVSRGVLCSFY